MTLDEITIKYNCDKSSKGHDYSKIYDKFFSDMRNKPINILEIGVREALSLKTWYDYFPNANIFGIDIDPACKQYENDRTKIFIGDQADSSFLINNFQNISFDIILDDGSHNSSDQKISFETLFKYLKSKGLYIIEDLDMAFYGDGHIIRDLLKDKLDLVLKFNNNCDIESMHFSTELCIMTKN